MKKNNLSAVILFLFLGLAPVFAESNIGWDFVFVEGGTFAMGSETGEEDEKPVHSVTIDSFDKCIHQVTQSEYYSIMGSISSYYKGQNLPVEWVTWYEAVEYCVRRSLAEGLTPCYRGSRDKGYTCNFKANGYRLPTEAEWEYAARGGVKCYLDTDFSGSDYITGVAWYNDAKTHDIMMKTPNELGIYDMTGNVCEWCWDWYGTYSSKPQSNPRGAVAGLYKVVRGVTCTGRVFYNGTYIEKFDTYRIDYRSYEPPDGVGSDNPRYYENPLGFRVVRSCLAN